MFAELIEGLMDHKIVLRVLIVGEAVLGVCGGVVDPVFSNLPQALQDYQASQQGQPMLIVDAGMSAAFVGVIIGWIGLWWLEIWGRTIYTASTVAYYCLTPFGDPDVISAFGQALIELSAMCSGGVLAIVWLLPFPQVFSEDSGMSELKQRVGDKGPFRLVWARLAVTCCGFEALQGAVQSFLVR